MRKLYPLAGATVALLLSVLNPMHAAVSQDAYGWTIVTPSEDSRIVYVSSSEGLDTNDGLSPQTPKQTIANAQNLIRTGYPDHLLLKRGDTFTVPGNGIGRFKSGRSAEEPILVSYYGEAGLRPVIEVTTNFVHHGTQARSHQYFIGLDFYRPRSDPDSSQFEHVSTASALRFVGGGENILVEDCRFRFSTISAESTSPLEYQNIVIRRNIIVDAWTTDSSTTDSHTSGVYFSRINGYLIEENFFDHCGWNEQLEDAKANMFAHNVYIQHTNKAGGIFRGNISARGSSHGVQMRSGGIVERNLFVLNAVSAYVGGVNAPLDPAVLTYDNVFRENVLLNGRLMDTSDSSWPRTNAVWGMLVGYLGEVDVIDNVVANRRDNGGNIAFGTREQPASLAMQDNIVYQWDSTQDMFNSSWPHPDDDVGDYYKTLFTTNATGEAATIEYLNWQRERPIKTLPWEMTAYASINYIREGFNKAPVAGYYDYDGAPGGNPATNIALGATVTVSAHDGNVGGNLVDDDLDGSSRWSALGFSQWAEIDLGAPFAVDEIRVHPYQNRAYQYEVEASLDGISYGTIVDRSSNTTGGEVISDVISPVSARYIRITVTGVSGYTGSWVSFREVKVMGTPLEKQNVALGAAVTASTFQDDSLSYQPPEQLVDGETDDSSRWSALNFPQWALIDLGSPFAIEEIRVHPYHNRAYQYTIEASNNGVNYTTIVDRSSNTTTGSIISDLFSPLTARYIRINVTGASGYTGSWISIREVEVMSVGPDL